MKSSKKNANDAKLFFRAWFKDPGYEQYNDCINYLFLTILRFHFRWFLDCGEWFMYIEWWTKKITYSARFSSAGNMFTKHRNK